MIDLVDAHAYICVRLSQRHGIEACPQDYSLADTALCRRCEAVFCEAASCCDEQAQGARCGVICKLGDDAVCVQAEHDASERIIEDPPRVMVLVRSPVCGCTECGPTGLLFLHEPPPRLCSALEVARSAAQRAATLDIGTHRSLRIPGTSDLLRNRTSL